MKCLSPYNIQEALRETITLIKILLLCKILEFYICGFCKILSTLFNTQNVLIIFPAYTMYSTNLIMELIVAVSNQLQLSLQWYITILVKKVDIE